MWNRSEDDEIIEGGALGLFHGICSALKIYGVILITAYVLWVLYKGIA